MKISSLHSPIQAIFLLVALLFVMTAQAETWQLASPNGRVQIEVTRNGEGLPRYSVSYDGNTVIAPSSMGLITMPNTDEYSLPVTMDPETTLFLTGFSATEVIRRSVDETYHIVVGKASSAPDRYHEMTLRFPFANGSSHLDLIFRAYDEGAAFRYVIPPQPQLREYTIYGEYTGFAFPRDYACWGANMGRYNTSHEMEFDPVMASKIRLHNRYDSPLVCKTGHAETTFALAESDVENYPGAYYSRPWENWLGVTLNLSPVPDSTRSSSYSAYAAKITQTDTPLRTPWRVIMLGDSPRALVESSLVATLGAPSRVADTSWIRSGKAAWEWWNNWHAPVKNEGRNTETYLAYIDFAAEMGLEYLLIDVGWYQGSSYFYHDNYDLTQAIPEIDMPRLLAHAKAHNVGVFVWVQWEMLDRKMDEVFATYQRWGLAGIKPDFMDSNHQDMVNWYHKVLSKAAEHHLLVDLHGAYPPNGLVRTYPNYINQEGILAAEYNKFTDRITARHNVTLPYTRMILGPMDYTPGGFTHSTPEDFIARNDRPMVMTTRGHGIAMYVVYDSPFVMVSDEPQAYRNADGSWADGADFIREVPTTWDETRVLQGDIGEYIVSARRKGDTWYLGAMTNEDGRRLDIPLDFLANGTYEAKIWQDGRDISSLDISTRRLDRNARLAMKLAPSGGGVAVFRPIRR